jgi:hypothetical protein
MKEAPKAVGDVSFFRVGRNRQKMFVAVHLQRAPVLLHNNVLVHLFKYITIISYTRRKRTT